MMLSQKLQKKVCYIRFRMFISKLACLKINTSILFCLLVIWFVRSLTCLRDHVCHKMLEQQFELTFLKPLRISQPHDFCLSRTIIKWCPFTHPYSETFVKRPRVLMDRWSLTQGLKINMKLTAEFWFCLFNIVCGNLNMFYLTNCMS